MQVRLYSTTVPETSTKHAVAFTRPGIELISHQVDYPIKFALAKGKSADDLLRFGKQLNEGSFHIGVIWGLEYGWLRKRFPQLKPLAVLAHRDAAYRSQFLVHEKSEAKEFKDLRGKRIAIYPSLSLMDRMYLGKLLQQEHTTIKDYFSVMKYETGSAALLAVHEKKVDCVVMNKAAHARYSARVPAHAKLRRVAPSKPFPETVLVGRPERINGLKPELWEKLREGLKNLHRSAEGRQCVKFWGVARLTEPTEAFEKLVQEGTRDYPITLLKDIQPDRPR